MSLSDNDFQELLTLVDMVNYDQVLKLAERLRLRRNILATEVSSGLKIGDVVTFAGNTKFPTVTGEVVSVNKVTVVVWQRMPDDSIQKWKVPTNMITKKVV